MLTLIILILIKQSHLMSDSKLKSIEATRQELLEKIEVFKAKLYEIES